MEGFLSGLLLTTLLRFDLLPHSVISVLSSIRGWFRGRRHYEGRWKRWTSFFYHLRSQKVPKLMEFLC